MVIGVEFLPVAAAAATAPFLMLSVCNTEADIVAGLKMGADDYLTKPFAMQEFWRGSRHWRNRAPVAPRYVDYGDPQIDLVQPRLLSGRIH